MSNLGAGDSRIVFVFFLAVVRGPGVCYAVCSIVSAMDIAMLVAIKIESKQCEQEKEVLFTCLYQIL